MWDFTNNAFESSTVLDLIGN